MLARTTLPQLAVREPAPVVARVAAPVACVDRRQRVTARASPGPEVAYMTRQVATTPEWQADSSNQILQWQPRSPPAAPPTPPPTPSAKELPQLVDAQGKSAEQVIERLRQLLPFQHTLVATRVGTIVAQQVQAYFPDAKYHPRGRVLSVRSELSNKKAPKQPGAVCIVSGSTADEGLAEECRLVAEHLGCYAFQLRNTKVSFAGGYHTMPNLEAAQSADIVIVISGQDPALPGRLATMLDSPVIAVPTVDGQDRSVLGCIGSGVFSVVNVDDGQGAAFMAMRILRQAAKLRAAAVAHAASQCSTSTSTSSSTSTAISKTANGHYAPSAGAIYANGTAVPTHVNGSAANVDAEASATLMGPRCAWPPAKRANGHEAAPASANGHAANGHVVDGEQDAAPLAMGPRCAWPQAKPVNAQRIPAATSEANGHAAAGPAEAPAALMGPRCAWPQVKSVSSSAVPAAAPAAANGHAAASAEQEAVPMGPRCAWPRKQAMQ